MRHEEVRRALAEAVSLFPREAETPLGSGLDGEGLAAWVLRRHGEVGRRPWAELKEGLDAVLEECAGLPPLGSDSVGSFGAWLDRLHAALADAHPRATEMLLLRLEDMSPREIAESLGVGLRFVERVLSDLAYPRACP